MSTAQDVADAYKHLLKRKAEIKVKRREENRELKDLQTQVDQLTKDLGQGDLFSPIEKSKKSEGKSAKRKR